MRSDVPRILQELVAAAASELEIIDSRATRAEEELQCLHGDITLLTNKLEKLEKEQAKTTALKQILVAVLSEDLSQC